MDCAVFDMDLMPKYAVVIVAIAVNALVRIDTIAAWLPDPDDAIRATATIPATPMTMSPPTTTQRPVHALVR
jgi:hypothetical protein